MLDRLEEFDADAEKYAREIELSGITLLDERPDLELPAGAHPADLFYRTADWLALHFQKRVRLSQRATYFLAALMGLVFLVYSEYSGPSWMVLAFLALFFSGVALHLIGERRQWYRKYLDYRALAEGLRVQIYWNLSGVVNPTSAEFAYDSFLNKQDVEVGWIRHVMRSASMRRARGAQPDPGWVDWVVEQWVGHASSPIIRNACIKMPRITAGPAYWALSACGLALRWLSCSCSSAARLPRNRCRSCLC